MKEISSSGELGDSLGTGERERERETGGRRWRRVPHLLGSDPGDTTDVWTSCSHITSQVSNVTTLSPINRSQCPEGILYIPGP